MTTNTIYFSDIDGTLLNADREVSELLKEQVARLSTAGHPFILISSRMPAAMTHLQKDLGTGGLPLIAYNGGLVLVDEKVISSKPIPARITRAVREFQRGTSLSVQLFHGDEWYVESMDHYATREQRNTKVKPSVRKLDATIRDWDGRGTEAHKIMVMGKPEEIDEVVGILGRVFGKELHLYRSKDDYLEIASKDISKLTGIQTLLDHAYPDRTLADCVAFGDNYNDVEMLAGVGIGVAVGNARPEVVAVADAVTAGNKEDGVGKWLAENGTTGFN